MVDSTDKGEQSSSGEYISEHPAHWRIEPFIPIPPSDLREHLVAQLSNAGQIAHFDQVCQRIARWTQAYSQEHLGELEAAYAALDPDRDTSLLMTRSETESIEDAARVAELMRNILHAADYTELSREELEQACTVSSLWGVPIRVDLDIFQHLAVFARGDVVGVRELKRWQRFYRTELLEVDIYRRLVVLFQVRHDIKIDGEGQSDRLYLRMFKNIPKADVDMLLPGTTIRFGWFDHTKILIPSLGGIGMSLWKLVRLVLLVAVITTSKLLVLVGLLGATIGYVFRSVTSYFQTKKNYELNLTRSLYFQKLDSNAGVLYRVLAEAQHQQFREAILAYYALLTSTEPISRKRLKLYCERLLREALQVEVNFEVDDAITVLKTMQLVELQNDEKLTLRDNSESLPN